jgi:hypothetical protein
MLSDFQRSFVTGVAKNFAIRKQESQNPHPLRKQQRMRHPNGTQTAVETFSAALSRGVILVRA